MTVTRHRWWNNRGHRDSATVTVKIFLSGGDGDGEKFLSGGDSDDYGDFYSPVLTVMGRNILIVVERGQKNGGEKLLIRVSFWWIRWQNKNVPTQVVELL